MKLNWENGKISMLVNDAAITISFKDKVKCPNPFLANPALCTTCPVTLEPGTINKINVTMTEADIDKYHNSLIEFNTPKSANYFARNSVLPVQRGERHPLVLEVANPSKARIIIKANSVIAEGQIIDLDEDTQLNSTFDLNKISFYTRKQNIL